LGILSLKELKAELDEDIKTILESNFEVGITDTKSVPTIDTSDITYPNLDEKKLKAKSTYLLSCLFYIHIGLHQYFEGIRDLLC
jgi:hypothetical protein